MTAGSTSANSMTSNASSIQPRPPATSARCAPRVRLAPPAEHRPRLAPGLSQFGVGDSFRIDATFDETGASSMPAAFRPARNRRSRPSAPGVSPCTQIVSM